MTAHHRVFVAGPMPGRIVLVTGGAGAVGHDPVQLAAWAGATVIATIGSEAKAERARAGGVAYAIKYRTEDVAACVRDITGEAGVDHVVDVDFGGNPAATLASLRTGGCLALYASNCDREPHVSAAVVMQKHLAIHAVVLPSVPHEARRRAQSAIARFTAVPGPMLSVAAKLPLAETALVHEKVEVGGRVGTVFVETAK